MIISFSNSIIFQQLLRFIEPHNLGEQRWLLRPRAVPHGVFNFFEEKTARVEEVPHLEIRPVMPPGHISVCSRIEQGSIIHQTIPPLRMRWWNCLPVFADAACTIWHQEVR